MEGNEGACNYAIVDRPASTQMQHKKIGLLDMEQFLHVIVKLAFLAGGKEKTVDHKHEHDRKREIKKPQFDSRLAAYGKGGKG